MQPRMTDATKLIKRTIKRKISTTAAKEGKETDGNKKEKDAGGIEEEKYKQKEDDKQEGKDKQKKNDNKACGEDKMNDENEDKTDKMDEDKYVLDLQGNKFKKHTAMWKAIPKAVMIQSKIFASADCECTIDLLENIATTMDMDLNTMDRGKWINVFIKTKDFRGGRNKKHCIRIFGISLASSNPAEMFHMATNCWKPQ
jgi:hypothetical protein